MALPALITDFNKQTVNYGMAVGESLQKLGQQVGQTLAMQEYQRQAAELAPQLSETYKAAYTDIASGTSEGLARGMGTLIDVASKNPQLYSNPILSQMNQQAAQFGKQAADLTIALKAAQLRNTGVGGGGIPPGFFVDDTDADLELPVEELQAPTTTNQAQPAPAQKPATQPAPAPTTQEDLPPPGVMQQQQIQLPQPGEIRNTYDSVTQKPRKLVKSLAMLIGSPEVIGPKEYEVKGVTSQTASASSTGRLSKSQTTGKIKKQEKEAEKFEADVSELEAEAIILNSNSELINLLSQNGIENYSAKSTGEGSRATYRLFGPGIPEKDGKPGAIILNEGEFVAFGKLKDARGTLESRGYKLAPLPRTSARPNQVTGIDPLFQQAYDLLNKRGIAKPTAQQIQQVMMELSK